MSEIITRRDNTGLKFPGQKRTTLKRLGKRSLAQKMYEFSQHAYFVYEFQDFLDIMQETIWNELEMGRGITIPNLVSFALRENVPHLWKNPITKEMQMTSHNLSVKAKASPALLRHLKKVPMKKIRKQKYD